MSWVGWMGLGRSSKVWPRSRARARISTVAAWPLKRMMRVSGQCCADGDGGFDTVDLRHEHVGEDELRAVAPGLVDGLLRRRRRPRR